MNKELKSRRKNDTDYPQYKDKNFVEFINNEGIKVNITKIIRLKDCKTLEQGKVKIKELQKE